MIDIRIIANQLWFNGYLVAEIRQDLPSTVRADFERLFEREQKKP